MIYIEIFRALKYFTCVSKTRHAKRESKAHGMPQCVHDACITLCLLPALTLAAGLAMALSLGAQAVWVGTRFVCAEEAGAPPRHQKGILNADYHDTVSSAHTISYPRNLVSSRPRVLVSSCPRAAELASRPRSSAAPELPESFGQFDYLTKLTQRLFQMQKTI